MLTHLDSQGRANMVDVTDKAVTSREAVAQAVVRMRPETLAMIVKGDHPKGDVFAVARIAGIQAAKKTADLIPLCHPLMLTSVKVELSAQGTEAVLIVARCKLAGQTGVEMEALTVASVAALTIYDMCKAVDRGMTIESVRVLELCDPEDMDGARLRTADVAAWLRRHGVKAEAEARAHDDRAAGRRLLDCAAEMKAGAIVSGAWGHARMRQWIFGGVTQTLITESPVALLLAH